MHFSAVLLLSALVRIPWQTVGSAAVAWGVLGLCGAIYALAIARRMRTQSVYKPVFEDWLFHALLPITAYAVLGISALVAVTSTRDAAFGIGTAALLLLFTGIHNAWDAVAYHVIVNLGGKKTGDAADRVVQPGKRSKR